MVQEHFGRFFIIINEEYPFILEEEGVPSFGKVFYFTRVVSPQVHYFEFDWESTSRDCEDFGKRYDEFSTLFEVGRLFAFDLFKEVVR